MRVFRIENDEGTGPYGYPGELSYLHESHDIDATGDERPLPHNDERLALQWREITQISEWLFGFESIPAARAWLGALEVAQELDDRGFRLSAIDAPDADVMLGSKQLVFRAEVAERVGSYCLATEVFT